MLPSNLPAPVRVLVLIFSVVFLVFTAAYLAYQTPAAACVLEHYSDSPAYNSPINKSESIIDITLHKPDTSHSDTTSLQQVLQFIFNPKKFSLTEPSYIANGTEYKLHGTPLYTKPLGKDICIVDIDTRPYTNAHQVMHAGDFVWNDIDRYSAGMLSHYTYATLHGYDYKFINAANYTDRSPTWIKPSAIAHLLPSYKFVVFLDADAAFNAMHIPLEWLLNYWHISADVAIAMALDPNAPTNYDRLHRLLTNTGFMIVQHNAVAMDMLRAWDECPGETRYPGCAEWKQPRFHEQSAFGNYVRYDYGEWIRELPCDEANGEPEFGECRGVFVSHFWWRTDNVKRYFGMNALQALMGRVQGEMVERREEVVEVQAENVVANG